jgi:flagellar hook-associated protein 3 FlgL
MRITEGIISGRNLADLQRANAAVAKASMQVSTGNRLQRPSDDPQAVQKALNLRGDLAATAQYMDTASASQGWAQATDDALSDINDVLQRAREAVVQGGNGTMSQKDRNDIATQIDQLIGQAKASGNATFDGQYIFAGQKTDTAPYDPDGADTYNGDTGSIVRTIGPASMADVSTARAEAGALSNRLTTAANRLTDLQTSTEKVRSGVEYVDLAEAISQLSSQQAVYQAALQATGSSLSQRTLMDFLG